LVYELQVQEKIGTLWKPFLATDVQFEAVMLDPYIRKNFKPNSKNLTVDFKLPDHYGVFTFKVDYQRPGLTPIEISETVQVRPYRHDQYPRFITAAYPYYFNIFSMMAAFFVFSVVFLFHREKQEKVKTE
jgi:oligosaccharyltransferase complex subunit beta